MRTSALAILERFCAVLRFLVAPTRSENSSLSTHAPMRTFRAWYTWSLLRSVVDPRRSHLPGQRTVRWKKLNTHAQMRTFRACYTWSLLRVLVMPTRSENGALSTHAQCALPRLLYLIPFSQCCVSLSRLCASTLASCLSCWRAGIFFVMCMWRCAALGIAAKKDCFNLDN